MAWKLETIADEQTGQSITVDHDMLVGRHQEADVLLQVADVSRRHAALLLKDQALWVKDLGSSNGTFVNDIRVEQETELQSGDVLRFSTVQYMAQFLQDTTEQKTAVNAVEEEVVDPVEPTPAQQMNEQGMPSLADRAAETTVSANGMPVNVGVPKPAPIPENVDLNARTEHAKTEGVSMDIPAACVEQEQEAQKNVKVGLFSIIALVILAVIAWLFFK